MEFKKWLSESDVPGTITPQIGSSPLLSGLMKLKNGMESGKISTGYQDFSVIGQTFGISQEEMSNLLKLKVITRDENGWGIDNQKLISYIKLPPIPRKI